MDIVLPGDDYVLREWIGRDGSAVRSGEAVAIAVKRDGSNAVVTNPSAPAAPSVTKHKRPTKLNRKRKIGESQAENNTASTSNPVRPEVNSVSIVAPASGLLRIGGNGSDNSLLIGYIEACSHPGIMEGLCVVCGEPAVSSEPLPNVAYHPPSPSKATTQVTVSGGFTMTVSESEAQHISLQSTQKLVEQKKLSLVLDLDHTLLHATADPRSSAYESRADVRTLILPIMENTPHQRWLKHFVKLRPHVKEFLETAQSLFEISVYTAGTRVYAEQITMALSRYLVGSSTDDEDIQRLRHEVMVCENELKRLEEKNKELKSKDPKANEASNGVDTEALEKPSKKRCVTFTEPPAALKTDMISQSKLDQKRLKLKEAERLDKEALALRQNLFGSRIVSRTDVSDLGKDVKSLKRVFPCGGTMAVIVDDREDVWANAEDNSSKKGEPPENLLLVRPYHWKPFSGFADVNNAAGQTLLGPLSNGFDKPDAGEEWDVQLLWTTDILKRLHQRFFSGNHSAQVKVPKLLEDMRQEVLRGCTLALSGLVPLHKQNLGPEAPRPPAIRYAETLGAKVSDSINDKVTHLVASRDGTDKIINARKIPGCAIVKASWLMECYWSIKRQDFQPHILGAPPKAKPAATTPAGNEDGDSSDEDDDFAAELEAELLG